ncbi:MAG: transglutaminase family protein [Parasphingorhabdus sp.]
MLKLAKTLLVSISLFSASQVLPNSNGTVADQVHAVLTQDEKKDDLLSAKLAFDQIIDPSIDPKNTKFQIDLMVADVRTRLGQRYGSIDILKAVQKVIYEPGKGNQNRPFAYDLKDPLGLDVRNKLLSTYFEKRLGNCVSMPILQLILADRMGVNVRLSTAPLHMFVRYTDKRGNALNIEATSGGHPARASWYRQNFQITDKAIENGIYMRTLTKRETVAHMATTVMEWLMIEGRYQEAIDVADVILEHFPKDVYTVLKRGHAHGEILKRDFLNKYPLASAVPVSLQPRYQYLAKQNEEAFKKAEAWGWQAPK